MSLAWEVRLCDHLQMFGRLQPAWSRLQLFSLLEEDFDLCVVIDTDTMAVQRMDELFGHEAPAAAWPKTKAGRQAENLYGGSASGGQQLQGISEGLAIVSSRP